jgi:hypothetical protein
MPTRNPRRNGRFSKTTVYAKIPTAPWKSPAPPTPVMARPTMKVGDFAEVAQIIEPTVDSMS